MKYLVCPYGLVMPCPTGVASVTGDCAEPYTVAEEEKTVCVVCCMLYVWCGWWLVI